MVKDIVKNGKKYYQCGLCDFLYEDRIWAEKCEKFCRENKACSVEITKHAIVYK
jgi:hypothetical protein